MNSNYLYLLEHPALQHKLGILRNRQTSSAEVRRIIAEISMLLGYEASRKLSLRHTAVTSPLGPVIVNQIEQTPLVVSILRAGNSMLEGVLVILPEAQIGHIGIYRDKLTQNTVEYYFRLPDKNHVEGKEVFLIDPLVATGDTVLAAIMRLKQFGIAKISVLCVLISKSAVERIQFFYPEVMIYTLGIEENMDDQGYLIPGLGDVSSRLYGWIREANAI